MKIVFMGTPEFALPGLRALAASRHQILAVVTGQDVPKGRGRKVDEPPVKTLARELGLEILQPESLRDEQLAGRLRQLDPDLFVVVAFRILPKLLLEVPRFGSINLHASLLPKYRGAAPINWALINGDRETGITIFQIEPKVDTGAIITRRRLAIGEDDTAGSLSEKLSRIGAEALVQSLDDLENAHITKLAQDNSLASSAPKIYPEMGKLDWSQPAQTLKNLIHGLSPSPGAFCLFGGKRLKILKASWKEDPAAELPGTIVHLDKSALAIQTGRGLLCPEVLQTEGKRALPVAAFLNGFAGQIGDRFTS